MKMSPGDPGSHVTRSKAKAKAGKARQRKNLKKEYAFSRSSKQSQQYLNYFNPTMDAEMALIGFDNLVGILLYLSGPRFFLAVNLQDVKTCLQASRPIRIVKTSFSRPSEKQLTPSSKILILSFFQVRESKIKLRKKAAGNGITKR